MEEAWELAALEMLPPNEDIDDRLDVWEAMEIFWLDTDVNIRFEKTVEICANSKYSLPDLDAIFWNEAFPAFKFNLMNIAGEWAGFPRDWIVERVLKKHKFGKPVNHLRGIMGERNHWRNLEKNVARSRFAGQ